MCKPSRQLLAAVERIKREAKEAGVPARFEPGTRRKIKPRMVIAGYTIGMPAKLGEREEYAVTKSARRAIAKAKSVEGARA